MTDFARMQRLIKLRPDFVDFLSEKKRERDLKHYDERIEALRCAKENLRRAPITRLGRNEVQSAANLCRDNKWSEEDVAYFVEEFQTKFPNAARITTKGLFGNVSRLGDALMAS